MLLFVRVGVLCTGAVHCSERITCQFVKLPEGFLCLLAELCRDIHHQSIRHIQIEDLLMREPIQVDMRAISAQIEGKTVLITGAAGSIGSEITRQVASFNPYRLILVDQAETPLHDIHLELTELWRDIDASIIVADISHPERMESIFSTYRPQYVFHAAAYKHVPMMENNVSEAIQNNVLGTKIIADLSLKYGAEKFVMISTDKAVNPSNVMGCSKRICEIYVQSLAKKLQKEGRTDATQFITTRFGNVLGSNGSVIPLFRKQIEAGGPVTVTHPDIIRYFMTIPEACRLVLEAGSMGSGGEIYIFDMGRPVKIVDLAKKMITLSGRHDIKIEFTGLRRGEKLYEELLNTKENTTATRHDKILIAKVREYDFDEVSRSIQDIIDASYGFDAMGICLRQPRVVSVFFGQDDRFSRQPPVDGQLRIIPGDAPLFGRRIIVVAFVLENSRFAQNAEPVCKTPRDKDLASIFRAQVAGDPLPESRGTPAQVHGNVPHCPLHHADELALAKKASLIMQAADDSVDRTALIVLHKTHGTDGGIEYALRPGLKKIAPVVPEHVRLEDHDIGYAGPDYLHSLSTHSRSVSCQWGISSPKVSLTSDLSRTE